uniref:Salivary endonuclease n=1 Tax=Phlebotomus orientalis TaxID=99786 RepID=V5K6C9_PHLOR|nr:salivary endonuclease [Phlebotomus orientalis]
MINSTVIQFIFLLLLGKSRSAPKTCEINLPTSIPTKGEPIYLLNGNGSVFRPDGRLTQLNIGDSLTIYCPGQKELKRVPCGPRFSLEDITCTSNVHSELVETEEKCGRDGKYYNISFPLPTNTFHTIYRTCFNRQKLTPIYSYHVINGKAVGYHVKQPRGNFRPGKGVYRKININELYKTHISRFKRIFGATQTFFRKPLHYLARGHLSPEVDFVFGTEQHATEFYINTAPQYQSINQGNWLRVEKHVRKLAKALQDDLHVVTGILGILKFSNKRTEREIYLGEGVIPVPQIFWKAVFHPKNSTAIVFVTSNNPHEKTFNPICKDVCETARLGDKQHESQNFSNHTVGFTICCELPDFLGNSRVILPKEFHGKNYRKLLKMPGKP